MKIESKLSVLVSNYNHGKYIDNLIHSIISQTLKPEKIIIIDDGSNDNSHQILQKYKSNKLFQIILNNKNEGVIFRMNQGLELINTEYFMVYGADDIILNNKAFEISINSLNQYPNAGLSSALVAELDNEYKLKKVIKTPIVSSKVKFFTHDEAIKKIENYGLYVNGHLTIMRTRYFKESVEIYPNIDQMTDICAFYILAINYGTIFIPKVFGGYRIQKDTGYASVKFKDKFKTYKNILRMLDIIKIKNYKNQNLSKLKEIVKINTKLFYIINNLKINEKKICSFLKIFKRVRFFIYFASLDKIYFFNYIKYKLKYIFFNEKI